MTDRDRFQQLFDDSIEYNEFMASLNPSLESIEDGQMQVMVPYDEYVAVEAPGIEGVVNAGVIAALLDLGGFVLRTTFDDIEDVSIITTDVNASYMQPARDDIWMTACVEQSGRTRGVVQMRFESKSDGELVTVATGRASFALRGR